MFRFKLRKDFSFIKKHLFILTFFLAVLVISGLVAVFSLTDVTFAEKLASVKSQILPSEESFAEVSLEGENLKLKLSVAENDKAPAQQFFQNLGIDFVDEIKIGVDKESVEKLSGLLPLKVNIEFDKQKVVFGNKSFGLLNSSLPSNRYEFATHSAKLVLQSNSEKDFKLEINSPKSLLSYATSSGKLHLSNRLDPSVFDLLERVSTINLRVNGKFVNGEIVLR